MATKGRIPRRERASGLGRGAGLAAALLAASSAQCRPLPSHGPGPHWVFDANDPGPSLPPEGRSLFDHLLLGEGGRLEAPFPFRALVARLESAIARTEGGPATTSVLIPRGRSLQRDAGAPEFFRYPRAVVVATGQPAASGARPELFLKDRLYLGYHEKASVVEVISYNETAGRFEFQVVKDYREGASPKVLYADRGLCTACHQNGGPLFSRPLWDETNANPGIAALLRQEDRDYYGLPVEPGVDVAYELDNATDRANRLAAYQALWREGCGPASDAAANDCRADLFVLALKRRLSGGVALDRGSPRYERTLGNRLPGRWRGQWPAGLALPDPDVPNRVPMKPAAYTASMPGRVPSTLPAAARARLVELVEQSDVPSAFEPLRPRPPLAVWTAPEKGSELLEELASGLGDFLAEGDLRRLDEHLSLQTTSRAVSAGACRVETAPRASGDTRVSFECAPHRAPSGATGDFPVALTGRLYVRAGRVVDGSVDSVSWDGQVEVPGLTVRAGSVALAGAGNRAVLTVRQRGTRLHARRLDGRRVEDLTLSWSGAATEGSPPPAPARVLVTLVDDFVPVEKAVDALAPDRSKDDPFGDRPFRRAAVLQALEVLIGLPPRPWCCEAAAFPPPVLDEHDGRPERATSGDPRLRALHRSCGRCHETANPLPPNFLHGSPAEVEAQVAGCAERILYRVSMWGLPAADRPKTPMPPASALATLAGPSAAVPDHPDLRLVKDYATDLLRNRQGRVPDLEEMDVRGYANLEACRLDSAPRSDGGP